MPAVETSQRESPTRDMSNRYSFTLGPRSSSSPLLVRGVLPREVPGVDDVELAVRQPLVEKLDVDQWYRRVRLAGVMICTGV